MAELDAKQLEARKVKRIRYFDGLFLRQEEFNLEQNYHIRMRRLHNYYLHNYGIVRGLEVVSGSVGDGTTATVTITPGMALIELISDIDYNNPENVSQEILITDETTLNIPYSDDFKDKEQRFIYLTHSVEKVDIYDDRGGKEQIHWWEKAVIQCKSELPEDTPMAVLAMVELTSAGGKITGITISYNDTNGHPLRTYAGSYGNITLPVENASDSDPLPTIQGKNFGDDENPKNGIQITAAVTDVQGDLQVNGSTEFSGDLTIVGETDFTGACTIVGATDITGDLTIRGNITVTDGGMARIHTVDAEVQDAIFRINRYDTAQVSQLQNSAGIEIFRGAIGGVEVTEKAQLVWNENDDKWYLGVTKTNGLVNITQLTDQSVIDIHRHSGLYTQSGSLALSVNSNGNIGIGNPPPAAQDGQLQVAGKIIATDLSITRDTTVQGTLSASTLTVTGLTTTNDLSVTNLTTTKDLSVTGAIIPSLGKSESNGIMFPKNPGGGTGDGAWIRYYPRVEEGCTLEIGISDNPGDHILLHSPGGVGIGINNLAGYKLNICSNGAGGSVLRLAGDIDLHGHDRLNLISFGNAGEYQILHKAAGIFGRNTLTLHVDEKDALGVYSTNWTPLLEVRGGTGDLYIRGNVGIGNASPTQKLDVSGKVKATAFIGDGSELTGTSQWGDVTGGILYDKGNVGISNGAIIPSLGSSETNGIMFPKNPAGRGTGDGAWVRYYRRVEEGCTLEIGISNDPGDHILFHAPGGVGIGIKELNGFKLNVCGDGAGGSVLRVGGNINLHGYDRLNLISFGVDGDYQISHKAAGVFDRNTLALHVDENDALGVYSTNWNPLLEICGGTGDLFVRGKVGIGTLERPSNLEVTGTVKADKFFGDGSNLSNIKSGQWNDTTGGIYYEGKVGIHEKLPAATLTVFRNIGDLQSEIPAIMLGNGKGSTAICQGSDEKNYMRIGWNGIDLTENPYASIDAVAPYPLVLQRGGGNVGIGTLKPVATLDVNGTINYTQLAKLETAAINEAVIRATILGFGNPEYHRTPGRAMMDGNETLIINLEGFWPNVRIDGKVSYGSSRSTKENIRDLSVKKALEIMDSLNPVEFYFKSDTQKSLNIGFIAEDVHETIATADRSGVVMMNIVGVLAKIVKEQQKAIGDLQKKVKALEPA